MRIRFGIGATAVTAVAVTSQTLLWGLLLLLLLWLLRGRWHASHHVGALLLLLLLHVGVVLLGRGRGRHSRARGVAGILHPSLCGSTAQKILSSELMARVGAHRLHVVEKTGFLSEDCLADGAGPHAQGRPLQARGHGCSGILVGRDVLPQRSLVHVRLATQRTLVAAGATLACSHANVVSSLVHDLHMFHQ